MLPNVASSRIHSKPVFKSWLPWLVGVVRRAAERLRLRAFQIERPERASLHEPSARIDPGRQIVPRRKLRVVDRRHFWEVVTELANVELREQAIGPDALVLAVVHPAVAILGERRLRSAKR